MKLVQQPREKYSNLLFVLFNALFLLGIFWMLPALGDPDAPAAGRARANHRVTATHRPGAVKPAASFSAFAHSVTRVLFKQPN